MDFPPGTRLVWHFPNTSSTCLFVLLIFTSFLLSLATCTPRKCSSNEKKPLWLVLLRRSIPSSSFVLAMPSLMGGNIFFSKRQKCSISSRVYASLWTILLSFAAFSPDVDLYNLASDFSTSGIHILLFISYSPLKYSPLSATRRRAWSPVLRPPDRFLKKPIQDRGGTDLTITY